jgi:rod shape-determining protein MreC
VRRPRFDEVATGEEWRSHDARTVTDSSSVVSALVQGSRATGIVRGQFGDSLIMDWLLQTEPVKEGDVVITAGLGIGVELRSLYPKGLVIGTIAQVQTAEAAAYPRSALM